MNKETKEFEVKFNFNWNYGISIEELKNDIEKLETLGATHLEMNIEKDYDTYFIEIKAFVNRIETDEELNARLKLESDKLEEIKRRELEQLEKLKLKYNV